MVRIVFLSWFIVVGALLAGLPRTSHSAAPVPVLALELVYQQSERRWFRDRPAFFETYLGNR